MRKFTKALPQVDFLFHEDSPKVKEMTEKTARNWKNAYLIANTDHDY